MCSILHVHILHLEAINSLRIDFRKMVLHYLIPTSFHFSFLFRIHYSGSSSKAAFIPPGPRKIRDLGGGKGLQDPLYFQLLPCSRLKRSCPPFSCPAFWTPKFGDTQCDLTSLVEKSKHSAIQQVSAVMPKAWCSCSPSPLPLHHSKLQSFFKQESGRRAAAAAEEDRGHLQQQIGKT